LINKFIRHLRQRTLCRTISNKIKKRIFNNKTSHSKKNHGERVKNTLEERINQEKQRFYKRHGYELDLEKPRSFSEKIIWKKIFDRNPLLPITADKYQVRYYVEQLVGKDEAAKILIPLLYVTENPDDIPFAELPASYIVKANNASNRNIIVEDNNKTEDEIKEKCWKWLAKPYNLENYEWAYQPIEPRIIIEKLIRDEEGNIPTDYKFYIFHGRCKLVHINYDRFNRRLKSLFSPNWELLPVKYRYDRGPFVDKPFNYQRMLKLAEKLGQDFDFVRVDIYSVGDKIYFGELTHYPGSGYSPFDPRSFDFELGRCWEIVLEYWKGKTNQA